MAEHKISVNGKHIINVSDSTDGKTISFTATIGLQNVIPDYLVVGLGWPSIFALQQKAHKDKFDWDVSAKSLQITGQGGCWTIHFKMYRPFIFSVPLSQKETELLQKALFTKRAHPGP